MTLEELEARFCSQTGKTIRYLCELHREAERWEGQQDRRPA